METTIQSNRNLVPEAVFDRLVGRVMKDKGFDRETAELCIDETLTFLRLCATGMGPFAPCEFVDDGWHTFLLYTREYAAFCEKVGGQFIHHAPNDDPTAPQANGGVAKTVEAFVAAGIDFDQSIWFGVAADCTDNNGWCNGGPTCGFKAEIQAEPFPSVPDGTPSDPHQIGPWARCIERPKALVSVGADCDGGCGPAANCSCS